MPLDEYASVRALKEHQLIHDVAMGIIKSEGIIWISVSAIPANHLDYGVIIAYVDTTMRKKMEMALIVNERKLKKSQSFAKIGTWQWNIKTNSHIWSEEIFSIYGRDPTLLPAMYPEVQKYFTPESWVPLAAAVEKCLANGDAYECDAEVVRTDGTHRWIVIMGESVRNEDGQIIELHSIIQDLTERRRIEIAIRETERLLNDIQSKTGFGTWSYDVGSQKAEWSKEMFNIWGLDPKFGPISYPEHQQWIHPHDYPSFDEAVREAIEFGKPYVLDLRIIRPDQTERTITTSCDPLVDVTGRVVKLRGSIYDITQRKQMEHNLQESESLYRSLVNNVPDYVMRFDQQHRHIFANDRSINSIGKTKEECIGKTHREIGFPDHLCDSWEHTIDRCFETKMLQTIILEWENVDEVKILELRAIPEFRQNNRVNTVLGIARDITESKHAETKLIDEQNKAQQANLAKSRFLATMSHEIRTPMNGILGMAQMLLMPNLTNSERQDYAKTILSSGQTLLALLNDILDLSKVEAGKTKLELTVLDPRVTIQEIKMLFAETARFKSLSIEVDWFGSNNQRYLCDSYRLCQILSNLVGNAIKFTTQGGVHITAHEVERNEQTATLKFSVSDTGLGIENGVQQILFEPFSQGDSSITRQHGGTGLGLSIVRGLVHLMGGEVGCESTLGQGSRFWFTIQADLVDTIENINPVEQPRPVIPMQLSGRVLVVEDNSTNCKVIEAFLHNFGVTVVLAKHGQQALDVIMTGDSADLILMDLHMPVMDGYTATERIRRWEKENAQPRRPIIALTSDAFEEDKQRCLAIGMDDFLSKPIILDSLKEILTKWFNVKSIIIPLPITSIEKKPVDVPRVISIIRELTPLLVKNKFDAIRHFNILQEALEGTDVAGEIAEIGQLVKEFNFSRTLEHLRRIIITRGWEEKI
ncbi:two-component system, sensor histidine kinase [Gammaproteobacteria bacterium]